MSLNYSFACNKRTLWSPLYVERPFCTSVYSPNITLREKGSLVTYSVLLYNSLTLVHVGLVAECPMDIRCSSKPWCCWQAWLRGWPGAKSSSVYVSSKAFPRPLLSVMSVSYCLVAGELWELKASSRPPVFPGQWGVGGAVMCSAGQLK